MNVLNNWVDQSKDQVNVSSMLNGGRTGSVGATAMIWGKVLVLKVQDANVEVTDCPENHSDAAPSMC